MKREIRTLVSVVVLLAFVVLPAIAAVGLYADQTYEFYASGDQTAYVLLYNFDTSALTWYGPYAGPTDFDVSFTRPAQDWIGLYTYNVNMAEYERAYYLYYAIV